MSRRQLHLGVFAIAPGNHIAGFDNASLDPGDLDDRSCRFRP